MEVYLQECFVNPVTAQFDLKTKDL